jgi:hypothetical protein
VPKTETIYSDEELGLQPGWDEQLDPNIRRELKQARIDRYQLKELEKEVSGYRRLSGFATAGIPQDEKGQAFAKIYEGSDDPAEIREGYQKLFGPLEGGGTGGSAGAELDAEGRIAAAGSAGASQGTPGTIDIGDAIKNAKTNAEVLEIIRTNGRAAGLSLPADS